MKYRKIGRSGLTVSEVSYGSWLTFSNQVDLDLAKDIIGKAFELGINSIDTADIYAGGAAESLLGEILPKRNRSEFVVATKAFWPMSDAPTNRGLSRKHLTDSLEASLARLRLPYADIFYCHRWDPETPLDETLETMDALVRRGKTLYWGTSEWTAEQIARACLRCAEKGWAPPAVNQPNYSLLVRTIESGILPVASACGMGTAVFSPLAQGILTGKYSGGAIPPGSRGGNDALNMWMKDSLADADLLARVDALGPVAASYGLEIGQLALAWILGRPGISSVIVGASTPEQLEKNARASGVTLEAGDVAKIEALFPLRA